MRGARGLTAALAVFACVCGCTWEERIVDVRGILHDVPGAQHGGAQEEDGGSTRRAGRGRSAAGPMDGQQLVIEHEDGTVTLVSDSPRHVVRHLWRGLLENDLEAFYEQLLSDRTKMEYLDRGREPEEAIDFLLKHREELVKFLSRMPMGELTPGLYLRKVSPDVYRLKLPPSSDLEFRYADFTWEGRTCRLVVIG